MTDTEKSRIEAICEVANVEDIGDLSDGFHTFNGLYEQRMILFAALVKAYKDKAWKSHRHEDGELCFGGGWFIVGIDTPKGSYTYHYEDKFWNMFDCVELPRSKHWDGHTEKDAMERLMSLGDLSEELKNCPYCGDTYIKIYHSRAGYQVGCNTVNCIACRGYARAYNTEKEAVEAWNRRANDERK